METETSTTPEGRTYVVGLPVVVTIAADGFVSVEVDVSELGVSIAEDGDSLANPEQTRADEALLTQWAKGHAVTAEGYAE